jgi:uncharacterized repeat protein (TIGR04076 family)
MPEEKQPEMQNVDMEFIAEVGKRIREGNRYFEEVTITGVNGACPYGHKENETYKVTNINSGGLCGSLYKSIHDSVITMHYGAKLPWEKSANTLQAVCPEMGKVMVEVKRCRKDDLKILRERGPARDITGKGFAALDQYKMFIEVLDVANQCTWGHKKGQRFEVDPFNVGGVCSMLYCQAYHTINILLSEKNLPWEREIHIANAVCPDTYNQTSYRITREPR